MLLAPQRNQGCVTYPAKIWLLLGELVNVIPSPTGGEGAWCGAVLSAAGLLSSPRVWPGFGGAQPAFANSAAALPKPFP